MLPPSLVQTMVLFLLMCAGFAAGKLKQLDAHTARTLSRFMVNFILPALVVASLQQPFSSELRDQAFLMLSLSFAIYFAAFPLAFLFAKLVGARGPERGIIIFACVFSNVAFMGIPVVSAVFGQKAIFPLSIFNIPFQLLAFSVGAAIISRHRVRGDATAAAGSSRLTAASFLTPTAIATVGGFILFLARIKLPEPLVDAMQVLGNTTTPLSSVIIGSVVSRSDVRGLVRSWRVYATSLYRLVLFPAMVFVALKVLGFSGFELQMPTLVLAMPVAANTTILAEAYGGDSETASALVFLSTLISLVTIPVIAALLVPQ